MKIEIDLFYQKDMLQRLGLTALQSSRCRLHKVQPLSEFRQRHPALNPVKTSAITNLPRTKFARQSRKVCTRFYPHILPGWGPWPSPRNPCEDFSRSCPLCSTDSCGTAAHTQHPQYGQEWVRWFPMCTVQQVIRYANSLFQSRESTHCLPHW